MNQPANLSELNINMDDMEDGINRVFLGGILIHTPELKGVRDRLVCNFQLINKTTDRTGKVRFVMQECTAWDKRAEEVAILKQGSIVLTSGQLRDVGRTLNELNCEEIIPGGIRRGK